MYGRTAVDFGSVAGSVLAVGPLGFLMFSTDECRYLLETRTDDECFFSLEITDGLVMRYLVRSYKHLTTPRFTDLGWRESCARYWSVYVGFL